MACRISRFTCRGVHPPEAMMHFPLFQIPPIFEKVSDSVENFPCFSTFPPVSRKLLFPPTFTNPSVLEKFTCCLHTLCVFRFPPYFDHDEFMHHPMHVLDAPVHVVASMTTMASVLYAPPSVVGV